MNKTHMYIYIYHFLQWKERRRDLCSNLETLTCQAGRITSLDIGLGEQNRTWADQINQVVHTKVIKSRLGTGPGRFRVEDQNQCPHARIGRHGAVGEFSTEAFTSSNNPGSPSYRPSHSGRRARWRS